MTDKFKFSTSTFSIWLIVAITLSCESFAVNPWDQLKTAVERGPIVENTCVALLETVAVHKKLFGAASQYTLNAYGAVLENLHQAPPQPSLNSGFAIITGKEVEGSFSATETAARLEAVLTVQAKEDEENGRTKKQMKWIAFSSPNEASALRIINNLKSRAMLLNSAWNSLSLMDLGMSIFTLINPVAKTIPGYNTPFSLNEKIDDFWNAWPKDQTSILLLSQTVKLDKIMIQNLLENKSDLSPVDKEKSILAERWRLFGDYNSLTVLTDLMIEKLPSGEHEVHVLVQYLDDKPKFPRKPKRIQEPQKTYITGRELVPVRVPSR